MHSLRYPEGSCSLVGGLNLITKLLPVVLNFANYLDVSPIISKGSSMSSPQTAVLVIDTGTESRTVLTDGCGDSCVGVLVPDTRCRVGTAVFI